MAEKSKSDYDKDYYDNQKIFMVVIGILGLGVYKYEHQIKLWFYDHMVMLFFSGFGVLMLAVMLGLRRIKKKDREFIQRAKSLSELKPTRSAKNYYERRKC